MKKLSTIFLFISLSLFSVQAAEKINIDEYYVKGMNHYKEKDFENSYELFSKIYLEKLSDMKFNFYFGRSAYETGHYENALAAFERVQIQDSSNLRNKLEMGRTYFMLKMYEDAENSFKEVLNNQNIPPHIKRNIELALSKVSKVQERSFTYATFGIDTIYDSNINYGSIDNYYYGGTNLAKIDEISDTALQVYAQIVNVYDIGDKNGFAIKNTFSAFLKNYTSYDNYDLKNFNYSPSLFYQETHFSAEFLLGLDALILGNKHYLSTITLQSKLGYNHSPTLQSLGYLKYQSKNFKQQKHYDLDANRYEASYALQQILSPRSFLQTRIIGALERKRHGSYIYVDYDEFKVNARYANQYNADYGINIFAQLHGRNYKDFSQGFGSTREEMRGFVSADFIVEFLPKLNLKLGTSYEYVDSNQDRFSYKKHTISAGIVKTF